jgi:hypothetical protein
VAAAPAAVAPAAVAVERGEVVGGTVAAVGWLASRQGSVVVGLEAVARGMVVVMAEAAALREVDWGGWQV